MTTDHQKLRIVSEKDALTAVVTIQNLGQKNGFKHKKISAISTAVSELTTNALKYAGNAIMSVRILHQRNRIGMEIIIEDRGPGIENLDKAMTDNFSTGGTLGLGLPGTKRLVDEFEIKTAPGKGTSVRIAIWEP